MFTDEKLLFEFIKNEVAHFLKEQEVAPGVADTQESDQLPQTEPGVGDDLGGIDFAAEIENETKSLMGLDADRELEQQTLSTIGPEDVEMPADPVNAIVEDVIQMLNKTRRPEAILQFVKHSIQRYFTDVTEATPIIKALWDTEEIVLRDVARRLLMFIKGI